MDKTIRNVICTVTSCLMRIVVIETDLNDKKLLQAGFEEVGTVKEELTEFKIEDHLSLTIIN